MDNGQGWLTITENIAVSLDSCCSLNLALSSRHSGVKVPEWVLYTELAGRGGQSGQMRYCS